MTGLAAYPGGGSSIGAAFAGPSLADVYDALGLQLDYLMGNYEGPAQLGPVLNASLAISGGLARHVVVYRTVTEGSARQAARAAGRQPPAGPSAWITAFGDGPGPIGYALLARRHFREFGTTREQLAQISLNARKHAQLNPVAVMQGPLSMDDYLSARMISDPLSLYDCDVHCDGATAVVLSAADYAADAPRPPVRVEAFGLAPPARSQYAQHVELQPGLRAAGQLWNRTDLRPADVDVAALYDGFSILTMLWLEALGFCPAGQSGAFVEGGQRIGLGGELPLNTQGGQLSGGRLTRARVRARGVPAVARSGGRPPGRFRPGRGGRRRGAAVRGLPAAAGGDLMTELANEPLNKPLRAPHLVRFAYQRTVGGATGRFLAGLARRELWGSRTADGRVVVPPLDHDPDSGEPAREFVRVADRGTVRSWTWVGSPGPGHPLPRPFAFAFIRLDGADTDLLHVVDVAAERELAAGLRVRAAWREQRTGSITDIEAFRPDARAGRRRAAGSRTARARCAAHHLRS